jgi:predicted nucleotidyltransferase
MLLARHTTEEPMNVRGLPEPAAELAARLRTYLPELKKKYAIRSLGLFGSYIHNRQTAESDVDLLVEFDDQAMSLLRFIQLEDDLSNLLGVKVDLVEKSTLKPAIGRRILDDEVRIL